MVFRSGFYFCPGGCGKCVSYERGSNRYNDYGFYVCEVCRREWPDRKRLLESLSRVGLRNDGFVEVLL